MRRAAWLALPRFCFTQRLEDDSRRQGRFGDARAKGCQRVLDRRRQGRRRANGATLPRPLDTQGVEGRQKIWNSGFFLQNVLDVADKYFLTVGTRVDGNSAFGKGFGLQIYPKASASWILSDESFYPDVGEMKLRAAFGRSGSEPPNT